MAQEKFEDRLNEVNEALQDILEDCNTELVAKEAEEASALNEIPAKIRSITGGGGGAQTDWNQQDSSAVDFLKNKPFDVKTQATWDIYPTGGELDPQNVNKLVYEESFSQGLGHTVYAGQIPNPDMSILSVGTKLVLVHGNVEYEDTVTAVAADLISTENYAQLSMAEPPLFVGAIPMGGYLVILENDDLPATPGSMIDVQYKIESTTKLSSSKLNLGPGMVNNNGELMPILTKKSITVENEKLVVPSYLLSSVCYAWSMNTTLPDSNQTGVMFGQWLDGSDFENSLSTDISHGYTWYYAINFPAPHLYKISTASQYEVDQGTYSLDLESVTDYEYVVTASNSELQNAITFYGSTYHLKEQGMDDYNFRYDGTNWYITNYTTPQLVNIADYGITISNSYTPSANDTIAITHNQVAEYLKADLSSYTISLEYV